MQIHVLLFPLLRQQLPNSENSCYLLFKLSCFVIEGILLSAFLSSLRLHSNKDDLAVKTISAFLSSLLLHSNKGDLAVKTISVNAAVAR